jgi:hypothetical protein
MTRQRKRDIQDVFKLNPHGFTYGFNLRKAKHKKGFYVSITNNKTTSRDISILYKRVMLLKNKLFRNEKNLFLGGWKDNKNFYLDLSIHIKDINTAINTAKAFNQKSIWDISKQDTINTIQ